MFWGGSRMANKGFKLGSTVEANWDADRFWDITKTLGRI